MCNCHKRPACLSFFDYVFLKCRRYFRCQHEDFRDNAVPLMLYDCSAMDPERPRLQKGEVITGDHGEKLVVWKFLGEGRCCTVYQADILSEEKEVALKIYNKGKNYESALQRELYILETIREQQDCKQFVKVLGYAQFKEHHCLIQELLDCNIRQIIFKNSRKGLALSCIQRFCKDVLNALNCLHKAEFIHGDLKPANIMWSPQDGCFKLVDFGLSFHTTEHDPHQVQSIGYQAPETKIWNKYKQECRMRSHSTLSEDEEDCSAVQTKPEKPSLPIDIWSFGCILLELYTGKKLFKNEKDPVNKCIHCQTFGNVQKCQTEVLVEGHLECRSLDEDYHADVLNDLKDFVKRCLQCNAENRIRVGEACQHSFLHHHMVPPHIQDLLLLPTCILRFINIIGEQEILHEDDYQDISCDIKAECEAYGPLENFILPKDGIAKGHAFVHFSFAQHAMEAFSRLSGLTFHDHTLVATYFPIDCWEKRELF